MREDDGLAFDVETRVAIMRRLGIRRLDMNGWEVELFDSVAPPAVAEEPAKAADIAELTKGMPEGDDALFWSTSGPLPSEYRDASTPPKE